jgi:hypothetical protein
VYVVCYTYRQDGRLRDLAGAWGYGLFLYEAREGGQVTHISKDRDAMRAAVLRWLKHTEAPPPAARS